MSIELKIVEFGKDGKPIAESLDDIELSKFETEEDLKTMVQGIMITGTVIRLFDKFNKMIDPRKLFGGKKQNSIQDAEIVGEEIIHRPSAAPQSQSPPAQVVVPATSPQPVQVFSKNTEPEYFTKGNIKFKMDNGKLYMKDWHEVEDYSIYRVKDNPENTEVKPYIIEVLDWIELDKEG